MTKRVKIVKVGNSAGVILPKDVLARLNLEVGDQLSLGETTDGVTLRRENEEFDAQMAEARAIMKDYRSALRELAK
ncbi:AbrB/MazE/SpoVT family DNA-binding domain-containing protein [Novosphingopyxis sp. YJ-S2-01]|uniref:AbrB/MazE/SpoVT family DNA-binding domain-containing protein n=1 Tax=Novosphingopyxis sp. YJ-S2-01 TaxID=2794021 RepID=UPI0018DBC35C|nr:AbrB/MazE/SpoVT family DNA-binding domain-containing protein [Novosphingopyxis sp. YJ-S2-01]MBH9537965.1 AbrB/MazE/SpoVT family DNA-binding domain-containing protein [Novosphingopyxis sp. YJ-S2-01]